MDVRVSSHNTAEIIYRKLLNPLYTFMEYIGFYEAFATILYRSISCIVSWNKANNNIKLFNTAKIFNARTTVWCNSGLGFTAMPSNILSLNMSSEEGG